MTVSPIECNPEEKGFYWLHHGRAWIVAEWNSWCWRLPGSSMCWYPEDIARGGEAMWCRDRLQLEVGPQIVTVLT